MPTAERTIKWVLFGAMLLVVPWPFYLIAVLSVTTIPVMLLSGPMLIVFTLPQAAIGAGVFYWIARALARRIAPSRARWPIAAAAVVAILAIAWLPVYGGGENLLGSSGKFHDLRTEIAHSKGELTSEDRERFRAMQRRAQALTPPQKAAEAAAKAPHATLEGVGQPQVRIEPDRPMAIAPAQPVFELTAEQWECTKTGKTLNECGVRIRVPSDAPRRAAP